MPSSVIGALRVELGLDSAKFKKGIDDSKAAMASLGKAAAVGFAALAAGAAVATRLFVDKTIVQQKAVHQLEATLKSTGEAAGLTSKQLQTLAGDLQNVTTYGDETTIAAESVLLTFTKIGKDVFPTALEAVLDMSTALGTDLKGSALQVGKALNDPAKGITALTRAGVSFSKEQIALIKHLTETNRVGEAQMLMLKELQTEFGGSARAARGTLKGALDALGNAWGDLFELSDEATDGLVGNIEEITQTLSAPETKAAFATFGGWLISTLNAGIGIAVTLIQQIERIKDALSSNEQKSTGGLEDRLRTLGLEAVNIENHILRIKEAMRRGGENDPLAAEFSAQINSLEEAKAENLAEQKRILDLLNTRDQTNSGTTVPTTPGLSLDDPFDPGSGASDSLKKLMSEGAALYASTRTAAEKYSATMAHLNDLLAASAIDQDTYNRAVIQAQDAYQQAEEGANGLSDAMKALDLSQSLVLDGLSDINTALWDGTDIWSAFANAGVSALKRIGNEVITSGITNLFGAIKVSSIPDNQPIDLMGGGGDFWSTLLKNLFGFADGGAGVVPGTGPADSRVFMAAVTPGEPYAFGDAALNGILGNQSGHDGEAAGGATQVNNWYVSTPSPRAFQQSQASVARSAGRLISRVGRFT